MFPLMLSSESYLREVNHSSATDKRLYWILLSGERATGNAKNIKNIKKMFTLTVLLRIAIAVTGVWGSTKKILFTFAFVLQNITYIVHNIHGPLLN